MNIRIYCCLGLLLALNSAATSQRRLLAATQSVV